MSGAVSPSPPTGPTSAPAPNGAYSLWPEKARKSMPAAAMSIGRCGASCAASTTSRAPYRCAIAASRSSGQVSPVTLDAPVTATMSKRGRAPRSARSVAAHSASADAGNGSSSTSWRRQGSRLAWCSTGLPSTRVPGGSAAARTLIASVVLRTRTTSSPAGAPTKARTSSRTRSNASVATCDLAPLPRWTLLYQGMNAATASQTSGNAGVLAA